jgi:hypothetical protein
MESPKTPSYTRNAIKAYRIREKAKDPEEFNRKNREYLKKHREKKKLEKEQKMAKNEEK